MTADEAVIYTRGDDGIAWITLHRPHVHNALDQRTMNALAGALDLYDADDDAAVAVLRGAGPSFCAGADVTAFGQSTSARRRLRGLSEALLQRDKYKPLIAAAHGHVIGAGLRLLLLADLALCAADARLCVSEVRHGLDAGPYWALLGARAGDAFAMEVAATGRTFIGSEAAARGVVAKSVPESRLKQEASNLARQLQAQPNEALRALVEARRSELRRLEFAAWLTRGRDLAWGRVSASSMRGDATR
jgi:enoyl-CoA hydratase/carnithine racemase